jgi:membrane protein implicated in regulation of membrane protease activity
MLGFLAIGGIGLVLLVISLVLGEILEGVFDAFDGGGGTLSTPVIGSFLAAFGFGGALTLYGTGAGIPAASLAGILSGGVVGWLALLLTRSLINMPTDQSHRTGDLVGLRATVVTPIPESGYGEVSVSHLGQSMKYNARSTKAIPFGVQVEVTAVISSSALLVEPVDD